MPILDHHTHERITPPVGASSGRDVHKADRISDQTNQRAVGPRLITVYRVRGQVVQIITIHDARQQWPDDWRKA